MRCSLRLLSRSARARLAGKLSLNVLGEASPALAQGCFEIKVPTGTPPVACQSASRLPVRIYAGLTMGTGSVSVSYACTRKGCVGCWKADRNLPPRAILSVHCIVLLALLAPSLALSFRWTVVLFHLEVDSQPRISSGQSS